MTGPPAPASRSPRAHNSCSHPDQAGGEAGGGSTPAQPEVTPEQKQKVGAHERRKPSGRKPLPEHLPHILVGVLPPEVQQAGLEAFERIGEEVSEVLERRPASLVAVRTVRPKFVPKAKPEERAAQ